MPDFEQKIQHCYHNQFFVTKDMGKNKFHRSCLERINLSWFVTTLSSAKTKHLLGILICRHFDAVCFYGAHSFSRGNHASDLKHAQSFCRCVARAYDGKIVRSRDAQRNTELYYSWACLNFFGRHKPDETSQRMQPSQAFSSFPEKFTLESIDGTILRRMLVYCRLPFPTPTPPLLSPTPSPRAPYTIQNWLTFLQ